MEILTLAGIALIITVFLCLYRVVRGPGVYNRIVAANTIGTKTIVLLVIIGYVYGRPLFIDIAILYAMVNFIATVVIAKYLRDGCVC
jgi:multicomponent Na+:H+ antiporter subunit F